MTSGHDLHKPLVQALLVALFLLCSAAAVLGEERTGNEPVAVSTVGRAFLPYVFVAGSSEPLSPLPLPLHVVTVDRTAGGVVSSEPAGIDCGDRCSEEFSWGTIIALTAAPDPYYLFGGWEGACQTEDLSCELFVSSSAQLTATFIPVSHEIAVAKAGDGDGVVLSQPPGIDCGSDCIARYDHGTPITLTATAAISSTFSGWSGACSGMDPLCQLSADAAQTVTATFALKRHVLIVNNSGEGSGSVTSQPPGIACGNDCVETYAYGTAVTLQAAVLVDSDFNGWTGACAGAEFTCQVTMDAAKVVTARFAKTSYPLTVSKTGDGDGRILSTPAGVDCGDDCGESIVHGTVVTLTAAPRGRWDFRRLGWRMHRCRELYHHHGCSSTGRRYFQPGIRITSAGRRQSTGW